MSHPEAREAGLRPSAHPRPRHPLHLGVRLGLRAGLLAALSACTISPKAPPAPTPAPNANATAVPSPAPTPAPAAKPAPSLSSAATPRAYRLDAASHLYQRYDSKIFRGKLPPMLYAIGVLQVEVNAHGQVTGTSWMRAPSHAPQVVAEIEQMVRQAAPYPVPIRMGKVTYTDTWLWDKSGKFQLDTLTEGQL